MTKYLIVSAGRTSGRGTRGLNLYWFLKTYHAGAVRMVSPSQARSGATCEVLFVGMPTELRKDDFARIRYRQLVLFDYQDPVHFYIDEQTEFLRGLTDRYLKVWNESHWKTPWTLGTLPIRRQARLPLYLRWLGFRSALGSKPPARDIDVSFLGAPTGLDPESQRVQWLREIAASGGRFRFWGGLATTARMRADMVAGGLDGTGIYHDGGRLSYNAFFDVMRRSKAVLTPKGNARWSYRHYEAIYAGAIPISCDMRTTTLFIPLPLDGMVHVPDGAPVLDKIDAGIVLADTSDCRERNIAFLERYLERGDYSRRKPELLERFTGQLS